MLGGRFSINGGALPGPSGRICYFGPDTLDWEALELGHGQFVQWALTGGTTEFYADLRWDGWEDEVDRLALDQGLSVWPPLFTEKGRDRAGASRRPVPWAELAGFHDDMRRQLGPARQG